MKWWMVALNARCDSLQLAATRCNSLRLAATRCNSQIIKTHPPAKILYDPKEAPWVPVPGGGRAPATATGSSSALATHCSEMARRISTLAMLTASALVARAQPVILMIGDSSGSYGGLSLEDFCDGATVVNQAIGGTTTSDWGRAEIASAFQGGCRYTHVWIGIGGNDLLNSAGCSLSKATLKQRLQTVVNNVKQFKPAGAKMIATGYCTPTGETDNCGDPTVSNSVLNGAWADVAATEPELTFVSSANACGAERPGDWSPGTHHVDVIHFNNRGYCKVWTAPTLQAELGCCAKEYTCATVPLTVKGGVADETQVRGSCAGASGASGCAVQPPVAVTPPVVETPTTPFANAVTYAPQSYNLQSAAQITSWTPVYAFTNGERGGEWDQGPNRWGPCDTTLSPGPTFLP